MKTYLGFEDIPAYNFYKITETSDVRWFLKKFRNNRDLVISEEESIQLAERYKEVYDARIKYTNDVKSIEYYRKLNEVSDLETKLFRLTTAFDSLIDIPFHNKLFKEYLNYFKDSENFSYTKDVETEEEALEYVNWLGSQIKGFKTKVAVKKSNYSDILKPVNVNEKNANFDIVKEKIILQESLSIMIDVYKCPLIEWCAMIIRAETKAEDSKRQIDNIKNKR